MQNLPITEQQLNRNYLIRYYPNSQDRNGHQLISTPTMVGLIDDDKVLNGVLTRVDSSPNNKTVVRLRRGIEFVFYYR